MAASCRAVVSIFLPSFANKLVALSQVHAHDDDVTLRSKSVSERATCATCSRRMSKFHTYVGAAVQAVALGLLSLRGLFVVGQEASEDFYRLLGASLVRGPFEKWRR